MEQNEALREEGDAEGANFNLVNQLFDEECEWSRECRAEVAAREVGTSPAQHYPCGEKNSTDSTRFMDELDVMRDVITSDRAH